MKYALFVATVMSTVACSADEARFSAFVVDAITGDPISGASVKSWFETDIGWRAWNESPPVVTDEGVTDAQGLCRQRGKTNTGEVTCHAELGGKYYRGVFFRKLSSKNLFGVWQPDNLVATIRLQRVEHPIPLFVKYARPTVVDGTYDGTNAVLRYDLMLGDWLPPEGKGEKADLEVRTKMTINEVLLAKGDFKKVFFEFANEIDFPGRGNGCRSEITSPTSGIRLRMAPDNDYANKMILRQGTRKMIVGPNTYVKKFTDSDPNRCYYFRVRSRFDDKGNLVEAFYGKIYGDFNFHGRWDLGFQGVDFLYYLNPTPLDRNLEWDMKTNLCPGKRERVEKRP